MVSYTTSLKKYLKNFIEKVFKKKSNYGPDSILHTTKILIFLKESRKAICLKVPFDQDWCLAFYPIFVEMGHCEGHFCHLGRGEQLWKYLNT